MPTEKSSDSRREISESGKGLHFDDPPERGFALITTLVVAALLVCCVSVVVIKPFGAVIGGILINIGEWLQGGAMTP